jgi:hypothetical protein
VKRYDLKAFVTIPASNATEARELAADACAALSLISNLTIELDGGPAEEVYS